MLTCIGNRSNGLTRDRSWRRRFADNSSALELKPGAGTYERLLRVHYRDLADTVLRLGDHAEGGRAAGEGGGGLAPVQEWRDHKRAADILQLPATGEEDTAMAPRPAEQFPGLWRPSREIPPRSRQAGLQAGIGNIKTGQLEMSSMYAKNVVKFLKAEDGPTAVEYAVMLALIIVVCIGTITALGQQRQQHVPDRQERAAHR